MTPGQERSHRRQQWRAVRRHRKWRAEENLRAYDSLERLQPPREGYLLGVDGSEIPMKVAEDMAKARMRMPIIPGPYEPPPERPSKPEETS